MARRLEMSFIRTNPAATIPTFGHEDDVCCDLYLPEEFIIQPHSFRKVPLGLIALPPDGYHFQIYLRSSTPIRYPGLILGNHVGIVDPSFVGPQDELTLLLYNSSGEMIKLKQEERIAQLRLVKNLRATIRELSYEEYRGLERRNRGGCGSTGR